MADSLSRSEIESLLAAVQADSDAFPATTFDPGNNVDADSFRKKRMTPLETIRDRALQVMAQVLSLLTDESLVIGEIENGRTQESLPLPDDGPKFAAACSFGCAATEDWQIQFENSLATFIVNRMIGTADHSQSGQSRSLTLLEHGLIQTVCEEIADASQEEFGCRFTAKHSVDPLRHTDGLEVPHTFTANLRLADKDLGMIELKLPADAGKLMSSETPDHVQLEVILSEDRVEQELIGAWEIGDILLTDIPESAAVAVNCDGSPAFEGELGIHQGRKAVKVTNKLA